MFKRSKTLPWPPVILAIMSLPQRISQVAAPAINRMIIIMTVMMILRFLDTGFLSFFFDFFVERWSRLGESWAGLSSPLVSSKSKAWMGLRKSAVMSLGVDGGVVWG